MRASGFYPVPSSTSPDSDKARADRYEKALKAMRDLPLPQRVSYVYLGLINEALEGK